MIRSWITYCGLFFMVILLTSCEEPIDLKLKGMDQFYFVEGYVVTDSVNQYVVLKRTKNYMDNNTFESDQTADVKILEYYQDALIRVCGLHYSPANDRYETDSMFRGLPGYRYKLQINVAGKEIVATDTMRSIVNIDSIRFTELFSDYDTQLTAGIFFQEPILSEGDTYNWNSFYNDSLLTDSLVKKSFMTDVFMNGLYFNDFWIVDPSFFRKRKTTHYFVKQGDIITIETEVFNVLRYNYLQQVFQGYYSDGIPFMGPPANPQGNIYLDGKKQNVYGYFSTKAVSRISQVFDTTKLVKMPMPY